MRTSSWRPVQCDDWGFVEVLEVTMEDGDTPEDFLLFVKEKFQAHEIHYGKRCATIVRRSRAKDTETSSKKPGQRGAGLPAKPQGRPGTNGQRQRPSTEDCSDSEEWEEMIPSKRRKRK